MRMYEIQKNGKTINFARTMGYARDYIREDDPNARKSSRSITGVDIFTNGMSIIMIDIKPDKEGVIAKLNSLISKDSYVDVKGIEVTPAKKEEPVLPAPEEVGDPPLLPEQGALFEQLYLKQKRLHEKEEVVKSSKPCQQWDAQTQSYVSVYEDEDVTSPKHYIGLGITPLEYITANELDFLEGNVVKYITRYPHKGGVNDLLKARTYLEKLIEREVKKS